MIAQEERHVPCHCTPSKGSHTEQVGPGSLENWWKVCSSSSSSCKNQHIPNKDLSFGKTMDGQKQCLIQTICIYTEPGR